jgi:hypothetical protein
MEFLSNYMVRYVVEVLFMIFLTAFVLSMIISTWALFNRHFSSRGGDARWKRPEEIGVGCWKVPR